MLHLNNETELLICCIRNHFNPDIENKNKIEAISKRKIDWDYLFSIAVKHRVILLLWASLKSIPASGIPQAIFNKFTTEYKRYNFFNLVLVNEVRRLYTALKENNISFIFYKGITLAYLYPIHLLREWHDIDIIIQKEDLIKIHHLLYSLNYKPIIPQDEGRSYRILNDNEYKEHIDDKVNYACSFFNGITEIEIHWRLARSEEPIQFSMEKVWEHISYKKLLDMDIPILGPGDFILSTFFHHGIKSQGVNNGNWRQLRFIVDIAAILIHNKHENWGKILVSAKEKDIKKSLLIGSYMASLLFEIDLPKQLDYEISRDHSIKKLAISIYNHSFKAYREFDELVFTNRNIFYARGNLKYKIRKIFTPNIEDKILINLPTQLNFLYYFIRPFRLIKKYGNAYFKKKIESISM